MDIKPLDEKNYGFSYFILKNQSDNQLYLIDDFAALAFY